MKGPSETLRSSPCSSSSAQCDDAHAQASAAHTCTPRPCIWITWARRAWMPLRMVFWCSSELMPRLRTSLEEREPKEQRYKGLSPAPKRTSARGTARFKWGHHSLGGSGISGGPRHPRTQHLQTSLTGLSSWRQNPGSSSRRPGSCPCTWSSRWRPATPPPS